ncbi:MAG: hypothetical protein C5S45_05450 [Candidatus Methanocomedens sp.]|nr:MAG: hypothetical protein C5S45_05450 [ANME-2 cluster archaeon]
MYKTEKDRLNKKINEENISSSAKQALHNIVEEYFSISYRNISEERKNIEEKKFRMDHAEIRINCRRIESAKVREILGQIEHSLYTILDRSVDKTRKSKLENNSENSSSRVLVIRGLVRGIPYLGDAIDALIFGKS